MCDTERVRLAEVAEGRDVKSRKRWTAFRLTRRLVTPECLRIGLKNLLSNATRYTLVIRRSSFNWDTGETQVPELVLFESGHLSLDATLDPVLLKSRRVLLLLSVSDGGTARINLSTRQVSVWADTLELRRALESFNQHLRSGARSRFITPGWALFVAVIPVLWVILLVAIEDFVDHKAYQAYKALPWQYDLGRPIILLWPAFLLICLVITIVIIRSGPLRIWPDSFTVKALFRTAYKIRFGEASRRNLMTIFVAVITGVLVYLLTHI